MACPDVTNHKSILPDGIEDGTLTEPSGNQFLEVFLLWNVKESPCFLDFISLPIFLAPHPSSSHIIHSTFLTGWFMAQKGPIRAHLSTF